MSGPIQNAPSSAALVSSHGTPSSATRLRPPSKGSPSRALSPFRSLLDGPKTGAPLAAAAPLARSPSAEAPVRPMTLDKPRVGEPAERSGALSPHPRDAGLSTLATPDLSPLEPFRVNAALFAPTASAAPAPRADDVAFALASELVESMRVGRFGQSGHMVSMRLRAGARTVGVELREEHGELRLRLEGGSAAELEGLGARVRRELEERGLALGELELA